MVSIKTVAVLGGSGNLGPAIVRELVSAGFDVTGITREGSSNSTLKYPETLAVKQVDYTSFDSLKSAFDGQDAVVSVVATLAVPSQKTAVDAAVAAGVKRFIPSEFGINTRKLEGKAIGKILASKIGIVDYLDEKAKENPGFTWTGLSTGLFFDWGLAVGSLGINIKEKTANIVDSGNEKFQTSNLHQIGRAVAGILKHPDETANKYFATSSFNPSQNELVSVVEELIGSKLTINHLKSGDLHKAGEEKLAQGDYRAFGDFLKAHNHADGAGNDVKEDDSDNLNSVIGLPFEDLKESVRDWLKQAGAI
ncbi:hypothetical protein QBC34DRAFT_413025 [Podospora aff. communis PSN243]|uniref:NmrA-like domain-containing protein n=1 Tax=Podospora aff. communis PSN243 TaxID=3040156 RepID=A0AAV9GEJ5_9PEZI|nr:hypothetical protein QBC34DRAFT_413025 [Podospora aff. communis PSN243]